MPGPANMTEKVDDAFVFIVVCCIILLVIVTICTIGFLIKYNRKRHPRPEHVEENILLEIIWTVIPTILVLAMFYVGWVNFAYIRNAPKDSLTVHVTARQWSWLFTYGNGEISEVLNVPQGRPVKLLLTSTDVIHSLFIPAFRIKEDCVPGLTTHLWFTANEVETYDIFCTEYCGVGHSHMRSKVVVMTPADFNKWYYATPEKTAAQEGLKILRTKGCLGCHSLDGSRKVGPTFRNLVGTKEKVLIRGEERDVTVDESLIRRHILNPQSEIVKGYPPVMPKTPLTDEELNVIVAYLGMLK
jgi:cytochrome c oxidase subunit II